MQSYILTYSRLCVCVGGGGGGGESFWQISKEVDLHLLLPLRQRNANAGSWMVNQSNMSGTGPREDTNNYYHHNVLGDGYRLVFVLWFRYHSSGHGVSGWERGGGVDVAHTWGGGGGGGINGVISTLQHIKQVKRSGRLAARLKSGGRPRSKILRISMVSRWFLAAGLHERLIRPARALSPTLATWLSSSISLMSARKTGPPPDPIYIPPQPARPQWKQGAEWRQQQETQEGRQGP